MKLFMVILLTMFSMEASATSYWLRPSVAVGQKSISTDFGVYVSPLSDKAGSLFLFGGKVGHRFKYGNYLLGSISLLGIGFDAGAVQYKGKPRFTGSAIFGWLPLLKPFVHVTMLPDEGQEVEFGISIRALFGPVWKSPKGTP